MKKIALVILIGAIILSVSNVFSWWWMTLLCGFLIGFLRYSTAMIFCISTLTASFGWGIPFLYQILTSPIIKLAGAISSILGFGFLGEPLIIAAVILFGILLSFSGSWFAIALRPFMPTKILLIKF